MAHSAKERKYISLTRALYSNIVDFELPQWYYEMVEKDWENGGGYLPIEGWDFQPGDSVRDFFHNKREFHRWIGQDFFNLKKDVLHKGIIRARLWSEVYLKEYHDRLELTYGMVAGDVFKKKNLPMMQAWIAISGREYDLPIKSLKDLIEVLTNPLPYDIIVIDGPQPTEEVSLFIIKDSTGDEDTDLFRIQVPQACVEDWIETAWRKIERMAHPSKFPQLPELPLELPV